MGGAVQNCFHPINISWTARRSFYKEDKPLAKSFIEFPFIQYLLQTDASAGGQKTEQRLTG
jgi:hypothetical protein